MVLKPCFLSFYSDMRIKLILLLMLAIAAVEASAQTLYSRSQKNKYTLVQDYIDSLNIYKQRLDQALAGNDSLRAELDLTRKRPESYTMLTPLTYFGKVTGRSFSINGGDAAQMLIDSNMADMYVRRPDLVKDSQRKLNESGGIAFVPKAPVSQNVNFTTQQEREEGAVSDEPTIFTPVDLAPVRPNFWVFNGDYSLQFLQNYVSGNWYKGGESSYAMIGAVTLQLGYNDKSKVKFDNKLEMKLGMMSSQGDSVHSFKSSEDLIRLTSKLGVQASKRWYYTLQMLAETQFTHGYKSNETKVYSDFLSPLKLNFSLGMDYKVEWCKKRLTGTVNISPLAANLKYYDREANALSAGLEEGKRSKWDYGSTFTADLTWKFSDVVRWQTRLYAFSTYHRTEVEWENTFTVQLSKYISTKLFVYPRFDDNVKQRDDKYGYFQLKEYWSLGFNFTM